MNVPSRIRIASLVVVLLFLGTAAPSVAADPTVLRATVDGSVIDLTGDGTADFIYNDLGSVIVGFNAHFGPGEYRGVYEFDVRGIAPCAAGFTARLRLSQAGTFGTSGIAGDPNLTVYAGLGDGLLSFDDFGSGSLLAGFSAFDPATYPFPVIDATSAVESVMAAGGSYVSFVIRPNPVSADVVGAYLFSSNEITDTYGFSPTVLETHCATEKTAAEQVADLLVLVDSYGFEKLGTSLHDKLVTAQRFLAAGKPRQAKESVYSFLAEVAAQRGKGLTDPQADALDRAARRIITAIVT